jgi:hypothetical protein
MSLITGKDWGWGFRYDTQGLVRSHGTPVDDSMLGALDAPGCIPAGSHVSDTCHAQGTASTAVVRSTGRLTTIPTNDLV